MINGHKVYKDGVRSKEQGVRSYAFGGVRIGPKALEVGGAALRLEAINKPTAHPPTQFALLRGTGSAWSMQEWERSSELGVRRN